MRRETWAGSGDKDAHASGDGVAAKSSIYTLITPDLHLIYT
jgi:hypothetical protein